MRLIISNECEFIMDVKKIWKLIHPLKIVLQSNTIKEIGLFNWVINGPEEVVMIVDGRMASVVKGKAMDVEAIPLEHF